ALGEGAGLDDLLRGDLLVDVLEDPIGARLHPEAQPLTARQPHFQEELLAEHVDPRVTAPEELQATPPDLPTDLQRPLAVRGEGVVLDLDHLHRELLEGALDGVDDVLHGVSAEPPSPGRLRTAEGALPRAAPGGHEDVSPEVVVR